MIREKRTISFFLAKGDVGEKSEQAGYFNGKPDRSDFLFRLLDDLYLPLEQQLNGALPGYNVERFKQSIEH